MYNPDSTTQRAITSSTDRSQQVQSVAPEQVDVLVAGSLACDTICDHAPLQTATADSPAMHTSNPATITQSVGGVGCNVARAAHYAGAKVALASVVADDIAGLSLQDQLIRTGLTTEYVRQLKTVDGARTAQYVATNDTNKDLVIAMADMSIFTRPELHGIEYWSSLLDKAKPKWVIMDGNWSTPIMSSIIQATKQAQVPIAFEPVSTAKAARLFDKANTSITNTSVVPNHVLNIATPNLLELEAMHKAAQTTGLFDSEQWWQTIDSMGLSSSGSRDKFVALTNSSLADKGVPQQSIRLLPFIPTIITKLGPQGCLLTTLLRRGDERLTEPQSTPYILARTNSDSNPAVGGVYMRLFPPAEQVRAEDIVSVNGVGDTLVGTLLASLARKTMDAHVPRVEDCIPLAQRAAVLTLKSKEAVAPEVSRLSGLLVTGEEVK